MNSKVSIVIPNWNGKVLLEKNIPFWIEALNNKKNNIVEIVIIDDCSTDDSVPFIKKNFKDQIKLVCHKKNRGFASSVNTGFRSASGSLVCLLNTDVVPSKNFLEFVIPHFEDKKVFGVSLHEKGYGYAKGNFKNGYIVHEPGKEKKVSATTFWISGGSGVFSRKIWMDLGGLDEKIFAPFYWEDVDISYRALKRGYKLLWEPRGVVDHQHESTINKNNFKKNWILLIKERNHLLLNWKNLTSHNLMKKHQSGVLKRVIAHPGYLKVVLFALLKSREVFKARRKEEKESIVSDEAIFGSFSS